MALGPDPSRRRAVILAISSGVKLAVGNRGRGAQLSSASSARLRVHDGNDEHVLALGVFLHASAVFAENLAGEFFTDTKQARKIVGGVVEDPGFAQTRVESLRASG